MFSWMCFVTRLTFWYSTERTAGIRDAVTLFSDSWGPYLIQRLRIIRARYLKGQWYCFTLSLIHCFDRKLRIKTTVYTLIEFISVNVTLYLCVLILLLCIYCIKAFLVDCGLFI